MTTRKMPPLNRETARIGQKVVLCSSAVKSSKDLDLYLRIRLPATAFGVGVIKNLIRKINSLPEEDYAEVEWENGYRYKFWYLDCLVAV